MELALKQSIIEMYSLKNVPPAKLELIFYQIDAYPELNILKKELWINEQTKKVKGTQNQWETSYQVATTIAGLKVIAFKTDPLHWQDGPYWLTADRATGWKQEVYPEEQVIAAKVTIFRGGAKGGFTGIAYASEYSVSKDRDGNVKAKGMYATLPLHMLAKVAKSIAYREAFPCELSGLYTREELHAAGAEVQEISEKPSGYPPQVVEDPYRKEILRKINGFIKENGAPREWIKAATGLETFKGLNNEQLESAYSAMLNFALEGMPEVV